MKPSTVAFEIRQIVVRLREQNVGGRNVAALLQLAQQIDTPELEWIKLLPGVPAELCDKVDTLEEELSSAGEIYADSRAELSAEVGVLLAQVAQHWTPSQMAAAISEGIDSEVTK